MKDLLMVYPFLNSSPFIMQLAQFYRSIPHVEMVGTDSGKDPVVTYSDVEYMLPGIMDRIVKAEKEGYRGAVVGCFGDPGLVAARQLVSIPVMGPGETSLAIASTLGDRIVIFEPNNDYTYPTEKMVYSYGYRDKVVGVYPFDEIPLEMCIAAAVTDTEETRRLSQEVAAKVCAKVKETDAHVIILGCIGLAGFKKMVERAVKENGLSCPIVEPGATVANYGKLILELGLNQSREMWRL